MLLLWEKEMMILFTRYLKENRLGSSFETEMVFMKLEYMQEYQFSGFFLKSLFGKFHKMFTNTHHIIDMRNR